jgi:hypothetical protein
MTPQVSINKTKNVADSQTENSSHDQTLDQVVTPPAYPTQEKDKAIEMVKKGDREIYSGHLNDFWSRILDVYDVLVLSNQHNNADYEQIAKFMPFFVKKGGDVGFLEIPTSLQSHINELVENSIENSNQTFKYGNFLAREPIFLQANKLKLPLVGMDTDSYAGEGLGAGNKAAQERALKAYVEKYGLNKALEDSKAFSQQRMEDTKEWIKRIKDYVDEHQPNKLFVTGGSSHMTGLNDLDEMLLSELGKPTVFIAIHGEGARLISPVITRGGLALNDATALNGDDKPEFIVYGADKNIDLLPKQIEALHRYYDKLYEHPDAHFVTIEHAKWSHGLCLTSIQKAYDKINDMVEGRDKDINDYATYIKPRSQEDEELLVQTRSALKIALEAVEATPPDFISAKAAHEIAEMKLPLFGGGIDAMKTASDEAFAKIKEPSYPFANGKKVEALGSTQAWMSIATFSESLKPISESLAVAKFNHDRTIKKYTFDPP